MKYSFIYTVLSCFSCVQLFVTPWTVAHQGPPSMRFSRQAYWSGLPFPPPGDLLNPGIEPTSLVSPALAGRFFTASATWETLSYTLGWLKEKGQTIASVGKDAETLRIENEYLSSRQKEEVELPTEIGSIQRSEVLCIPREEGLRRKSPDSCFGCCQEVSEDPDQ